MDFNARQDKVPCLSFTSEDCDCENSLARVNLFTYKRHTSDVASVLISFGQTRMRANWLTHWPHSSKELILNEQIIKRSTNWGLLNTKTA